MERSDVKDLSIREEDNSVRLLVQSHDAVIKADRIAKEVHSLYFIPSNSLFSFRSPQGRFHSLMDSPLIVLILIHSLLNNWQWIDRNQWELPMEADYYIGVSKCPIGDIMTNED